MSIEYAGRRIRASKRTRSMHRLRHRWAMHLLAAALCLVGGGAGRAQTPGYDTTFADSFEDIANLPRLRRFAAEPSVVAPGSGSILSWQVDNATNIQINPS